jgi:hypothetical protein
VENFLPITLKLLLLSHRPFRAPVDLNNESKETTVTSSPKASVIGSNESKSVNGREIKEPSSPAPAVSSSSLSTGGGVTARSGSSDAERKQQRLERKRAKLISQYPREPEQTRLGLTLTLLDQFIPSHSICIISLILHLMVMMIYAVVNQ